MKMCKTCKEVKPISDFYKHKDTKDGCFPECKECNIKRANAWQKANWDKKLENDRKFWHRHRDKLIIESKKDRDIREYSGNRYKTLERDGYKCVNCGMSWEQHLEIYNSELNVDHIDRDRKNNSLDNLQTLCLVCHGKKHSEEGSVGWFKKGNVPHNKKLGSKQITRAG